MNDFDILIRPLKLRDINKNYISWFSDIKVTEYLKARNIFIKDSETYLKQGIKDCSYYIYAICDKSSKAHIGNIKIGPIRRLDGISDLVTLIGDKSYWGKGIASKAIKMIIQNAFYEGGIRKFSASIDSNNVASLKAYQKAGFKVEAKLNFFFCHYSRDDRTYSDKLYVVINNLEYDLKKLKNWKPISLSDIS